MDAVFGGDWNYGDILYHILELNINNEKITDNQLIEYKQQIKSNYELESVDELGWNESSGLEGTIIVHEDEINEQYIFIEENINNNIINITYNVINSGNIDKDLSLKTNIDKNNESIIKIPVEENRTLILMLVLKKSH